ncbi:HU family DNA-binding protein [Nonomuraea sp. LPB2021202275-12-8]|uniref:HU family DNA-binding protein n=1 Tax=Nonomuraea sp. LPB2021202275-12-8 TaxID=3120159 RepID=UPI00300C802A
MAKRTKADVAAATGVPMKTLNALIDYVKAEVAAGNEVQFTGFGAFKAVVSAEREVRVPSTGETKTAPAKFRPKFSAGAGFKDTVAAARKP